MKLDIGKLAEVVTLRNKIVSDEEIEAAETQMLKDALKRHSQILRQVNESIWNHPEIRFTEHYAHDLLTGVLEDQGFQVQKSYMLPTGFRAEYVAPENSKRNDLVNICFVCEYDALPGVGHACGHNLIAESGIAMALIVKEVIQRKPAQYIGKIIVIGTPGEEGGGGKIIMLDAFRDVHVAMMLHASNKGIVHTETLCSSRLYVQFKSEATDYFPTSHCAPLVKNSGMVLGSPSDAAVAAYNNIATLRAQIPQNWRIGVVIKDIEGHLGMEITYRTMKGADMPLLRKGVLTCIEGGAASAGCTFSFKYSDPYVDLWPNLALGNQFYRLVQRKATFQHGIEEGYNSLVSTDMGNVSQIVPSIHPMYFIDTNTSLHHPDFATRAKTLEAEAVMLDCACAVAHTGLLLIRCPHFLKQVQREFERKRTKESLA